MGLKGFIWLVLLIIISLLVFQNLQPVSLVFFGSKSINVPLSIWMLVFFIMGLVVSFIIQGLASTIGSNKKLKQEKTPYYPPSPPTYPENQINRDKQTPTYQPVNPTYREPYDDEFEFPQENTSEQNIEQKPFQESIKSDLAEEKIETNILEKVDTNEQIPLEKEENVEVKSETSAAKQISSRSPSLYSYKTKEKTQIRVKTSTSKISAKKTKNKPKNSIYDANYRIITPAKSTNNDDDYDNSYNQEEWDF